MIGIIGGSGLYRGLDGLGLGDEEEVTTEYGTAKVRRGKAGTTGVVFLSRHSSGGGLVPPHMIPHRANVMGLKEAGATGIIATATSGSLSDDVDVGQLVLPHQYLDVTKETYTFYAGGDKGLLHVDMSEPFCPSLRSVLIDAAKDEGLNLLDGGCYTCISGPQFETVAEAKMLAMLGGTVAGMTAVPEAKLARELGMCYQVVCLPVNRTGGLDENLTHDNTVRVMSEALPKMAMVLAAAAAAVGDRPACRCGDVAEPYK